ncbi:MAG: hypothetical protein FWG68_02755, partial [Defluviitaleaceae bacterium]|nr:hypothetical protein [Defluviitaleaceae bacterium]
VCPQPFRPFAPNHFARLPPTISPVCPNHSARLSIPIVALLAGRPFAPNHSARLPIPIVALLADITRLSTRFLLANCPIPK